MDEFSLINYITQSAYRRQEVIKGIGDDAAVFRSSYADMVVAVDTFVEGVHFTKQTLSPFQIGYRLLAANLSDIAAMGAEPLFYLVSIVIPSSVSDVVIKAIFSGMNHLAAEYDMDLIGGDTVTGNELTLSITVLGSCPRGKVRLRSSARPGDVVFVTGTLGDARAGLELLLKSNHEVNNHALRNELIKKHQQPTPRIEFAQALRALKRVALNDISDGVANELHEIAESSDVAIEITDGKVPISDGLRLFPQDEQRKYKYFGGEDFELVGTVRTADFPFVQSVGKTLGLKVTEIGTVSYNEGRKGRVYIEGEGDFHRLQKHGYVHRSRDKNDKNNND